MNRIWAFKSLKYLKISKNPRNILIASCNNLCEDSIFHEDDETASAKAVLCGSQSLTYHPWLVLGGLDVTEVWGRGNALRKTLFICSGIPNCADCYQGLAVSLFILTLVIIIIILFLNSIHLSGLVRRETWFWDQQWELLYQAYQMHTIADNVNMDVATVSSSFCWPVVLRYWDVQEVAYLKILLSNFC